jgi:hypothetical protein
MALPDQKRAAAARMIKRDAPDPTKFLGTVLDIAKLAASYGLGGAAGAGAAAVGEVVEDAVEEGEEVVEEVGKGAMKRSKLKK